MRDEIKRQVEACVGELRRNTLREESLRRIAELADRLPGGGRSGSQKSDGRPAGPAGRQELLYLQAEQTSVTSRVIGMGIFTGGRFSDGPDDAADWPYQTVADAMADGWRIVKFPEMAILLDDRRTYGLGCEFILEKWSTAA